jgi:hypothetical protein
MKKRVTFDFTETPIQDVVNLLGALVDLTFVLEIEPTKEGLPGVTLRVKDMAVGKALDPILKPLGLTHLLMDEAVLVTTPKRALELRPTAWRLYDLRQAAKSRLAPADVARAIRKACLTHPEWAPSHQIAEFQNRLILRTTPAVHAAVQKTVEEGVKATRRP